MSRMANLLQVLYQNLLARELLEAGWTSVPSNLSLTLTTTLTILKKKLYLPTDYAIDVTDAYELHRNNNNDFQLGKNDILDDNRRCFLNW